jgi:hypothetical protein
MAEPMTATEMLMRESAERNHREAILRRCVEAAIHEVEPDLRDPRTEQIAYRAATLAMEHTAKAIADARRVSDAFQGFAEKAA